MKQILTLFSLFFTTVLIGQHSLSVRVTDIDGSSQSDIVVFLQPGDNSAVTNAEGIARFDGLASGNYTLYVRSLQYGESEKSIQIPELDEVVFQLKKKSYILDEVSLIANWVKEKEPYTAQNKGETALQTEDVGHDVPYFLNSMASVVVNSDAGAGIGYTNLRVRGSDPTRINFTIDGIPLNDSESQGAFWVDLPDFISSTSDLQLQRGVGSSTNGGSAFGASVNLKTSIFRPDAYTRVEGMIGSYNSKKVGVSLGTGQLPNNLNFQGRFSKILSDGYVDRGSSDLTSAYLSGGWLGTNQSLSFKVFTGHEITYQAWNGLPAQFLDKEDMRTYNPSGLKTDGTFHEDEVDNYTQTHVHLHYNRVLGNDTKWSTKAHYTRGYGYFEQWKNDDKFSSYGIKPLYVGGDTITRSDIIRRRWLDNHFYGLMSHVDIKNVAGLDDVVIGGAWNQYLGGHYGQVIWAKFASDADYKHKYYDDDAVKNDLNFFVKFNKSFASSWTAFLDLQYRNVSYEYTGNLSQSETGKQSDNLNFFNPKLGLSYIPSRDRKHYVSVSVGHREPNRKDYTENIAGNLPKPERLIDVEAGIDYGFGKLNWQSNLYYMYYQDQLVSTGRINDVGAYIRQNVDKSYRLGWENTVNWQISKPWRLEANMTLSDNRILAFDEFYDNWDTWGQEKRSLEKTHLALSPQLVGYAKLAYEKSFANLQGIGVYVENKYVGKQYIDNTSTEAASIPGYFVQNIGLQYNRAKSVLGRFDVHLKLNNIWSKEYSSHAWIYRFATASDPRTYDNYAVQENEGRYALIGYYPQALFNFNLGVNFHF